MKARVILFTRSRATAVVDRFTQTRVGAFLQRHFAERFTKPSQTVFLLLAMGFLLSSVRHTVANYLWRSGACLLRHYTRFYAFLGGPFFCEMDGMWRAVIRQAARQVPEGEPVRLRIDETVCKKSGEEIEPADTYRNGAGTARNGAGTARQEYRTLWGICFAEGEMRVPLPGWSGKRTSVPIGLEVYLKEEKAEELGQPYARRSRLGQRLVKRVAEEVGPDRRVLSVQDGNYATQYFLQDLPENVSVVGRMPKNAALYERPGRQPEDKPGPDPKKGDKIGSPKELAESEPEWQEHPTEQEAEVYSFEAIWQSVLPGQVLRVAVLRRPHLKDASSPKKQKRYLEVFFTTDRRLSVEQILQEYRGRWSIEILIRKAKESFGLGQDRCRNTRKISGINNFRLLIGAAEVLYTSENKAESRKADKQHQTASETPEDIDQLRPWYEDSGPPKLFDLHWSIREELSGAGITPKVGLNATSGKFEQTGSSAQLHTG